MHGRHEKRLQFPLCRSVESGAGDGLSENILDTESGASLRAAGWVCAGLAGGKRWTGSRRPKEDLYPAQMKYRYEKSIGKEF